MCILPVINIYPSIDRFHGFATKTTPTKQIIKSSGHLKMLLITGHIRDTVFQAIN